MKRSTALALATLVFLACLLMPISRAGAEQELVPIEDLEKELSAIEEELSELEFKIDGMLEDLIDPTITSISIFFSAAQITGRVPASVELKMDGDVLAARTFSETDRLVLVRGGTIEVYGGIIDPVEHTLIVNCLLSSSDPSRYEPANASGAFKFSPRRSTANFLEIALNPENEKRSEALKITARHWSREP